MKLLGSDGPIEIFLAFSDWVEREAKHELWQLCRKTSRGPKSQNGRREHKHPELLKLSNWLNISPTPQTYFY